MVKLTYSVNVVSGVIVQADQIIITSSSHASLVIIPVVKVNHRVSHRLRHIIFVLLLHVFEGTVDQINFDSLGLTLDRGWNLSIGVKVRDWCLLNHTREVYVAHCCIIALCLLSRLSAKLLTRRVSVRHAMVVVCILLPILMYVQLRLRATTMQSPL